MLAVISVAVMCAVYVDNCLNHDACIVAFLCLQHTVYSDGAVCVCVYVCVCVCALQVYYSSPLPSPSPLPSERWRERLVEE